jgi:uncharacterized protein
VTSRIVVSVHDVAPATFACVEAWTDLLDVRGVRSTLLVIPGPYGGTSLTDDPRCAAWLRGRAAAGDEIALHGWEHRSLTPHRSLARAASGRVIARGCAELWDIHPAEVAPRLSRGRRVLTGAGLEVDGITPPGWLASRTTIGVAAALGFRYLATQWRILDLRDQRVVHLPAVSHRPGSRLEGLAARSLDRWARAALAGGRGLRLALHPRDVETKPLRDTTLRVLDAFLDAGADVVTYRHLLGISTPHRIGAAG